MIHWIVIEKIKVFREQYPELFILEDEKLPRPPTEVIIKKEDSRKKSDADRDLTPKNSNGGDAPVNFEKTDEVAV